MWGDGAPVLYLGTQYYGWIEENVVSLLRFLSKVALRGLTAAWGTLIMVSVCVMKKLHTENEVLVIIKRIIGWCS